MRRKYAIGIFGGTFNPIHNTHLKMAKLAKKKFGLKKVIFIPAGRPPHKEIYDRITLQERYRMICLALKGFPSFSTSPIELKRPGKSYSVETVESLKKRFRKDTELFFIIGSDSLAELFTWKRIYKLLRLCKFIVFQRPKFPVKVVNRRLENRVEFVSMRPQKVSSTEIRKMIKKGQDISNFVPKSVARFITKRKLYR